MQNMSEEQRLGYERQNWIVNFTIKHEYYGQTAALYFYAKDILW
jgi:hypothetical protein